MQNIYCEDIDMVIYNAMILERYKRRIYTPDPYNPDTSIVITSKEPKKSNIRRRIHHCVNNIICG